MSSSAIHLQDQRGRTHGGVWLVVSWTLSARARLLLTFILLISGVALRIAGDCSSTGSKRACRVVPALDHRPQLSSAGSPGIVTARRSKPGQTARRAAADSPVQVNRRNAAAGAWAGTCHSCQTCSALANYSKKRLGVGIGDPQKSIGSWADNAGPGAKNAGRVTVAAPRRWLRDYCSPCARSD